jgi:hypothetical protein
MKSVISDALKGSDNEDGLNSPNRRATTNFTSIQEALDGSSPFRI